MARARKALRDFYKTYGYLPEDFDLAHLDGAEIGAALDVISGYRRDHVDLGGAAGFERQ